jgi:GTP cyclohydrolase II
MADVPIFDEPSPEAKLASVQKAMTSLRRGMPVVIASHPPLAMIAAETAGEPGLLAFDRLAAGPASVVLAPDRAAAVLGRPIAVAGAVALRRIDGRFDEPALRALADPTLAAVSMTIEPSPPPPGADAAIALAKLSRLLPALLVASAPAGMPGLPPEDVLGHIALSASLLERVSEAVVPIEDMADCRVIAFRAPGTSLEHIAILCGRPEDVPAPLVRVHSECFTGDLLGSLRCDCGPQLRGAIHRIAAEGAGAVLYLPQEGRGIGLPNKLRAYALQDRGLDTLDANRALGFRADERDFHAAATMLHHLGLTRIRLLTNNPEKVAALAAYGITIEGREGLQIAANGVDDLYLQTKARRFGHYLG